MNRLLIGLLLCLGCGPSGGGGGGSDAGPRGFDTGGSAGAPPGVANPSAPVDEPAIAQYAREVCDFYVRCGPTIYPDRATCVEATSCSLRSLLLGTALARGELLSCSHWLTNVACGTMPAVPHACVVISDAIASALGAEAGCGGERCDMGSYCDRSDDHCPRCAPYVGLGEPCLDERCERTTYCSASTLVCEPEKTVGMPCERSSECSQLTFGTDAWLICRDGVCKKPAEAGAPCEETAHCTGFLRCQGGVCTERARVGAACVENQDCTTYSACIREVCTAVCGFQRVGEACFNDAFCIDSYCDEAASSCLAQKPASAPCTRDAECSDGHFCAAPSASCTARFADGTACTLDDECQSGLCNGQLCQQPICED